MRCCSPVCQAFSRATMPATSGSPSTTSPVSAWVRSRKTCESIFKTCPSQHSQPRWPMTRTRTLSRATHPTLALRTLGRGHAHLLAAPSTAAARTRDPDRLNLEAAGSDRTAAATALPVRALIRALLLLPAAAHVATTRTPAVLRPSADAANPATPAPHPPRLATVASRGPRRLRAADATAPLSADPALPPPSGPQRALPLAHSAPIRAGQLVSPLAPAAPRLANPLVVSHLVASPLVRSAPIPAGQPV